MPEVCKLSPLEHMGERRGAITYQWKNLLSVGGGVFRTVVTHSLYKFGWYRVMEWLMHATSCSEAAPKQ